MRSSYTDQLTRPGTAREWLRVGHALRALPDIAAAFRDGLLSYAKVRTLTRIAVDHPDRQGELIDLARDCTAAALPAELARWTAAEEDPEVRDRRHHRDTALTVRTEPDGTALITLRLPPLAADQAMAAIDTHAKSTTPRPNTQSGENTTADAPPPRNVATRRATLAQQRAWAAHHLLTNGGQAVTTEILIHVRDDGATLTGGTPISDHVLAQLAPTAFFRALIHDADQRPINASATPPPANNASSPNATTTPAPTPAAPPPPTSNTTTNPPTTPPATPSPTNSTSSAPNTTANDTNPEHTAEVVPRARACCA